MGLFGAYLAYQHGKKKAIRKAEREDMRDERRRRQDSASNEPFDDDESCEDCGYAFSKHSDDDPPQCPSY